MYEKIKECPLCKSTNFTNHIIAEDYMVSHENFAVVKCDQCNFLITNPRPAKNNISKYYLSADYISHTDKAINPVQLVYKLARNYTLYQKVKLLNQLLIKGEPKSVLDIGCGTGDFLYTCKKNNWQVNGFEPEEQARQLAVQKNGLVIADQLKNLKPNLKYSIITLWHVLEHVHDLDEMMLVLKKQLTRKGRVILALPNPNSWDAKHYDKYWAAWDLPRHLYHFTKDTVKVMAKKYEFKIDKILPMKLDSFYVSMLSEKYKTGTNNYYKAIINGIESNNKSKVNDNNYSSLIYILKK